MKKFLTGVVALAAMALLLLGVGIVAPETPLAGTAAEAALALIESGRVSADEVAVAMSRCT